MKDSHLTLRLPADLARALDRRAGERDTGRSQLVREAVTAYLAGTAAPAARPTLSGLELARRWRTVPHLTADEATALATDIAAGRRRLPPPADRWK